MDGALLTLLFVTLTNLTLGLFIYFRNRNNAANQLFLALTVAIIGWTITNFLTNVVYGDVILNEIANKLAYMLAFCIALVAVLFTYQYPLKRKASRVEVVFVGVSAVLMLGGSLHPSIAGHILSKDGELLFQAGRLVWVYAAFFLAMILVCCMNLLSAARTSSAQAKNQAIYILLAFSVTAVLGLFFNLVIPVFASDWATTHIGPLSTVVLVGVISYSMRRHGLFDIRSFFVRAVVYTFTNILISVLYVAPIVIVFLLLFHEAIEPYRLIIGTLVGSVVAANYSHIKTYFNRFSNRIFFREVYDPAQLLADLNKALVSKVGLQELVDETSGIIDRDFRPEYTTFLLRDKSDRLQQITRSNLPKLPILKLTDLSNRNKDSVIITRLLEQGSMRILLEENDIAALIRLTNAKSSSKALGYVVLGPRKSGKAYDLQDMQVLEAVGNTLVIAMQNALHFEEIQRFNATLQERVEEQTRKYRTANVKLKKLDETKDEFISMASHQLRTPLTSVKGYLSMVLEGDTGPLKPQQEQLLKQSYLSSQRMVNLIADLLNLSRLNTGKFVIDAQPTDLRVIVDQEVSQLKESARAKSITMQWNAPTTFSLLSLDEGKMHQVVMNFIDNAIYYTPENGTILVTLTETEQAVEFRVKDSGIGVPRDQHRHLFTKFYRAENARRMRPDGTGLGLYMAKKVVVTQGGSIIFESQEGKGSTFGFRFSKTPIMPQ